MRFSNVSVTFSCIACVQPYSILVSSLLRLTCELHTRSAPLHYTPHLEHPVLKVDQYWPSRFQEPLTQEQPEMQSKGPTRHTYSAGGVVPKLNGANYFTWKTEVYNVAVTNGYADVLTGTKARPRGSPVLEIDDQVVGSDPAEHQGMRPADQRGAGLAHWESQNQKAKALLLRSVDEMFHWQLVDMELASDAWAYLDKVHSSTRASAILQLQREMYALRLDEDGEMEEHLRKFGSLAERGRQVGMEEFRTDAKTCTTFIETLSHLFKTIIRNPWSRLPQEDQTFAHLLRLYLEEMCERRAYAARSAAAQLRGR